MYNKDVIAIQYSISKVLRHIVDNTMSHLTKSLGRMLNKCLLSNARHSLHTTEVNEILISVY